MLRNAQLSDIVVPMLREALEPFGFDRAEVQGGVDHAGEPIVLARVHYRRGAPQPVGRVLLDMAVAIMNRLSEEGDDRFVHVSHVYADGPAAEDELLPRPNRTRRASSR